jgi:hypothetical protein
VTTETPPASRERSPAEKRRMRGIALGISVCAGAHCERHSAMNGGALQPRDREVPASRTCLPQRCPQSDPEGLSFGVDDSSARTSGARINKRRRMQRARWTAPQTEGFARIIRSKLRISPAPAAGRSATNNGALQAAHHAHAAMSSDACNAAARIGAAAALILSPSCATPGTSMSVQLQWIPSRSPIARALAMKRCARSSRVPP